MGFVLSGEGGTVDLTDMGIQAYDFWEPVRLAELQLVDGNWSLQQRGAMAPKFRFAGNFRPDNTPGGSGITEWNTLMAGKTLLWTVAFVTTLADGTQEEDAIGSGYLDGEPHRGVEPESMRDGLALFENWDFSFKMNPPDETPAPDPSTEGEGPVGEVGNLGDDAL